MPDEETDNQEPETDSDGQTEEGGEERESPYEFGRLFRYECLISDADLRVEVADQISRTVGGDEKIDLEDSDLDVKGNSFISRLARSRTITGSYSYTSQASETWLIGDSVREEVSGGVKLHARVESEAIVGGAYVSSIVGPYLRICAWADFLCWGGWAEIDVARVELAAVMIRAYVFVAHAVGARVNLHRVYIDDISNRIESFGVFVNMTTNITDIGIPGAGDTLEA